MCAMGMLYLGRQIGKVRANHLHKKIVLSRFRVARDCNKIFQGLNAGPGGKRGIKKSWMSRGRARGGLDFEVFQGFERTSTILLCLPKA